MFKERILIYHYLIYSSEVPWVTSTILIIHIFLLFGTMQGYGVDPFDVQGSTLSSGWEGLSSVTSSSQIFQGCGFNSYRRHLFQLLHFSDRIALGLDDLMQVHELMKTSLWLVSSFVSILITTELSTYNDSHSSRYLQTWNYTEAHTRAAKAMYVTSC